MKGRKKMDRKKIAVTCSGFSLDAPMDGRFGRCAGFAVYDRETGKVDFIRNTAAAADCGAGPAAVAIVAGCGAGKVVSGAFGFKAESMLNELGIETETAAAGRTVREILEELVGKPVR